ncbi:MAG: hypothetical protein AAGI03_00265 [Pseudomonadota bacterium]
MAEATSQPAIGRAASEAPRFDGEVQRVIDHERAGNRAVPFEDDAQRLTYPEAMERELNEEQIDQLRAGTPMS